jgi:hypothetical protein
MGECKNEHMCDEIAERSFNYQLDSYLKKLEEEYFKTGGLKSNGREASIT